MTSFSTMKTRPDKMYHVFAASSSLKIFVQILSVLVWICHHRWNGWRKLGFVKVVTWISQSWSIYFRISLYMPSQMKWLKETATGIWWKEPLQAASSALGKKLWIQEGLNHQNQRHGFLMDFSKLLHGFVKIETGISLCCYMDFSIVIHGFP